MYTHISTDKLPLLLGLLDLPARRRQLARVKSLYIEYCPKGQDPTYARLCGQGENLWKSCGIVGDEHKRKEQDRDDECDALELTLSKVVKMGPKEVFPNLESIAISSIYGNDDEEEWAAYNKAHSSGSADSYLTLNAKTTLCSRVFRLFLHSSTVLHLCSRDTQGPLSFPTASYASLHGKRKPPLIPTIHFNESIQRMPITYGAPMKWVSETAMACDTQVVNSRILQCLNTCIAQREADFEKRRRPDVIDLDVYFTTAMMVKKSNSPELSDEVGLEDPQGRRHTQSEEQQAATAVLIGKNISGYLEKLPPSPSGKKDEIRWHSSVDTPQCLACLTGRPV